MANPTDKNPAIDNFLSGIMGKSRIQTIKENKCMWCGGEATSFRDVVSEREYAISGYCQSCQDKVFEN